MLDMPLLIMKTSSIWKENKNWVSLPIWESGEISNISENGIFSSMKSSFLIIILGIMMIISIYSMSDGYTMQHQQSQQQSTTDEEDFVLEVHNVSTNPIVTKFLIRDEVYDEICPLGQCSIEYDPNSSVTFSLPDDNYPFMYYSFQFSINYNNLSNSENNTNIGMVEEKLKDHSIKFLSGESTCHINFHKSIVNEKQQIYYCEDDGIDTSITRIYDNKKWYYDAIEKYDAELDIFTLNGTFRN